MSLRGGTGNCAIATSNTGHERHEPPPVVADSNAPLVVVVRMGEHFFTPKRITPSRTNDRFEVSNPGIAPHECLIGDRYTQDDTEVVSASVLAGGGEVK